MRLTIDLDEPSQFQLLKTYFNLKRLGLEMEIETSARKGWHFIIYGIPLSQEQVLELRRLHGDDLNRILFDEKPYPKPKQILWTKKGKAQVQPKTEKDLLSEPFYSKMPARKFIP